MSTMKQNVFLRAPGNYDADLASAHDELFCDPDEGMTDPSHADEADINTIVRRFGLTGQIPGDFAMPVSGDFTGVSDFQSAMNVVRAAEEAFMEVPAELRARFGNDPGALMAFVENDANRDEAMKLGLLRKPPEVTRDVVQAIDELSAKILPALPTAKS